MLGFPVDCAPTIDADSDEGRSPDPYKESHEQDAYPTTNPSADDVHHHIEESNEVPAMACLTLLIADLLADVVWMTLRLSSSPNSWNMAASGKRQWVRQS